MESNQRLHHVTYPDVFSWIDQSDSDSDSDAPWHGRRGRQRGRGWRECNNNDTGDSNNGNVGGGGGGVGGRKHRQVKIERKKLSLWIQHSSRYQTGVKKMWHQQSIWQWKGILRKFCFPHMHPQNGGEGLCMAIYHRSKATMVQKEKRDYATHLPPAYAVTNTEMRCISLDQNATDVLCGLTRKSLERGWKNSAKPMRLQRMEQLKRMTVIRKITKRRKGKTNPPMMTLKTMNEMGAHCLNEA